MNRPKPQVQLHSQDSSLGSLAPGRNPRPPRGGSGCAAVGALQRTHASGTTSARVTDLVNRRHVGAVRQERLYHRSVPLNAGPVQADALALESRHVVSTVPQRERPRHFPTRIILSEGGAPSTVVQSLPRAGMNTDIADMLTLSGHRTEASGTRARTYLVNRRHVCVVLQQCLHHRMPPGLGGFVQTCLHVLETRRVVSTVPQRTRPGYGWMPFRVVHPARDAHPTTTTCTTHIISGVSPQRASKLLSCSFSMQSH
jgi:hypothetical protein